MKLKSIIIAGLLALAMGPVAAFAADPSYKEVFRVTEGEIIDFAVASAVEPGYFRDMIGGRNMIGGQSPIVYATPYLSADWGYVAGYEPKSRGSLMVGGTLRINKILEDYFGGGVTWVRRTVPVVDNNWKKLWFGPFVAHNFTNDDLFGGIKAGLSF